MIFLHFSRFGCLLDSFSVWKCQLIGRLSLQSAQLAAVESAATTFGGWKSFIPSLDFRASSSDTTFPYLVLQLLITDVH